MTCILIVDDDDANREFLVTLLGYKGYEVREAVDGAEALASVRCEKPDLVVADILMPTMDGYEFVRQLRDDPAIADTPVVFYTAVYHERETRSLAQSCGVSHVLTKPCEPEVVLQTIELALEATTDSPPVVRDGESFDREHVRVMTDKLSRTVADLAIVNQRVDALIDINLRLASERDPKRLLDNVCIAARDLVGARYALLLAGKRNGRKVLYSTTAGLDAATTGALEYTSLDHGKIGVVYTERRPIRLSNADGDPAVMGLPTGHPPVRSVLAAPIMSLKHVYGWICLSGRIGSDDFSDEDERMLSILSAQVGRIYENDELYLELQQNEARLRQITEHIQDVFFLTDPAEDRMEYVSPAYETIWGRSVASLYENPSSWLDAVDPDDRIRIATILEQTRTTGSFDYEYRIVRPDGDIRWILSRGFPVRDEHGNIHRIAGVAKDVTERKRSEQKIERLNRVYAVLSGINSAIVRLRDSQSLFEEACRILVEDGGFEMAWIGILDPDTLAVTPAAWRCPPSDTDLLSIVQYSADEHATGGRTTIGKAIRERRPIASNDLALAESHLVFDELIRRGYRSVVSLPLLSEESCLGVIVLDSKEPGTFDEEELKLLTELAQDVAFALDYISNEKRIERLAFHDPLTDLPNRTSLYQHLARMIDDDGSERRLFALLLLDINNFKDINHTLGHHNGDLLLKAIAKRVRKAVFEADVVARLGADEFAILISRLTQAGDLDLVANKILEVLKKTFVVEGIPVQIEARMGMALYPDHGNTADLLWQHADIALRAAKNLYRARMFYDSGIGHYDPDRLAMLGGFRNALDHDELVLHYQPMIDLRTEHTRGVEALLRWQHPKHGLLYPDVFIPMVEQTELIDALTTWVLANAMRQAYLWLRTGWALTVSVNISVRNLQNPNLCVEIQDLARSSRFPLDSLRLEITESAVMSDPVRARSMLQELTDAGIHLSLDDFGTGQSSLAYVKNLPIGNVKIDKSFVTDFEAPGNAAIVRTAVELAHSLGLTVTAEGVESESAYRALRDLDCDLAQGYFFSKPLPVDRIAAWMSGSEWRYVSGRG